MCAFFLVLTTMTTTTTRPTHRSTPALATTAVTSMPDPPDSVRTVFACASGGVGVVGDCVAAASSIVDPGECDGALDSPLSVAVVSIRLPPEFAVLLSSPSRLEIELYVPGGAGATSFAVGELVVDRGSSALTSGDSVAISVVSGKAGAGFELDEAPATGSVGVVSSAD